METQFLFPNEVEKSVLWGLIIVLYPFMTSTIFGGMFVSALPTLFGRKALEPVARLGLAVGLTFLPFVFLPILLDLGQPVRAFNIMATPRFCSPMAVFGFVFTFVAVVIALHAWFVFRKDLAARAREKTGFMRCVYWILVLGVTEVTPQAERIDRGLAKFLKIVALPADALLTGYVAFIFATVPGNPEWNSTIRPVVLLLAGIVTGASLTLLLGAIFKPAVLRDETVKALGVYLVAAVLAVAALTILEVVEIAYMDGYSATVIETLFAGGGPLATMFFTVFLGLGTCLPVAVLACAFALRLRGAPLKLAAMAAGVFGVLQSFALLWNIIVGGQLVSKSLRGVVAYTPAPAEIALTLGIAAMPLLAFVVINFLVPLAAPGGEETAPVPQA
ncbi:MAG: polysulfide reductase NrfD, partial [Planctomycetes bacterium]|nr:polysulfide reductase NrfD [Planctomycetota bacterium]